MTITITITMNNEQNNKLHVSSSFVGSFFDCLTCCCWLFVVCCWWWSTLVVGYEARWLFVVGCFLLLLVVFVNNEQWTKQRPLVAVIVVCRWLLLALCVVCCWLLLVVVNDGSMSLQSTYNRHCLLFVVYCWLLLVVVGYCWLLLVVVGYYCQWWFHITVKMLP